MGGLVRASVTHSLFLFFFLCLILEGFGADYFPVVLSSILILFVTTSFSSSSHSLPSISIPMMWRSNSKYAEKMDFLSSIYEKGKNGKPSRLNTHIEQQQQPCTFVFLASSRYLPLPCLVLPFFLYPFPSFFVRLLLLFVFAITSSTLIDVHISRDDETSHKQKISAHLKFISNIWSHTHTNWVMVSWWSHDEKVIIAKSLESLLHSVQWKRRRQSFEIFSLFPKKGREREPAHARRAIIFLYPHYQCTDTHTLFSSYDYFISQRDSISSGFRPFSPLIATYLASLRRRRWYFEHVFMISSENSYFIKTLNSIIETRVSLRIETYFFSFSRRCLHACERFWRSFPWITHTTHDFAFRMIARRRWWCRTASS